MSETIKLSSPATREFWELPVLFEDEHLLAIDKPARMKLLHAAIEAGKPWAAKRGLDYLMNAHRLDFETSGIILLAKTKPVLVALANLFGEEKPLKQYFALVHGNPVKNPLEVDAKLGPHPVKVGMVRVDEKTGKRARTRFE